MNSDSHLANYFIIYVATLLFFGVGAITTLGLGWYGMLVLPSWAPSPTLVAAIWTLLFLLAALSAGIVWNTSPRDKWFRTTITLYMGNALLILLWNYSFFGVHALFVAFIAAILVLLSVFALMILTWRVSRKASLLLAPYLAWMLFAACLMYVIFFLNP